jgi:alcohol dehydrogenase
MFFCPVKIVETSSLNDIGDLFKEMGNNCLIVTGKHSSKQNGSLNELKTVFENLGINYSVFDKVEPNPSFKNIIEGVTFAKNSIIPDFVVGLGGGSPMDAAKAIGVLLKNPSYRVLDLYNTDLGRDSISLVMIPTTAGTGSEVTQYSVLTNESTNIKKGFGSFGIFPKIAILNPKYQKVSPIKLVIDTGMDVLSHAVEAFLSTKATWYSDQIALKSIKMVKDFLQKSIEGSFEARNMMIRASTLAGIAIAQSGTIMIHAMGYPLTTFKGIPHGRANALLMPEVLNYLSKYTDKVYAIFDIFDSYDGFALFVKKFVEEKVELSEEEINEFSKLTIGAGNLAITPTKVSLYDVMELYSKI